MAKKKTRKKRPQAGSKTKPQRRRSCACMSSLFSALDKHPEIRANVAMNEAETGVKLRMGEAAFRTGITTVPVVVHVIHRTAAENISDAQVKSQIKVLNEDFRAKNKDVSKVPAPFKPLVGDAKIKFKLATKDPDGKSTTGITRTKTTAPFFSSDDKMKSSATGGIDAWDAKKYLNIWVCTLVDGVNDLLGYAYFPGVPDSIDGVVVLNTAFGTTGTAAAPFNKGRTTTHEIGHYLNLHHIWGGQSVSDPCSDSDFVSDTPNQFSSNGRTPTFPRISCRNEPHGDMFMNYMDYVDDAAMFMFSKGQVARMQASLTGPRSALGS